VTDTNRSNSGAADSTSLGLLDRARAQEPTACERLVHLYGPLVYSRCRRRGVNREDVLDLAQDVFRAVFQNLTGFRRDRPGDSFRAWLRVITDNRINDHLRRRRSQPPAPGGSDNLRQLEGVATETTDDSSASAGEGGAEADEVRVVLRQALELIRPQVNPKTWEAFRRVVMDGIAPAVVAQELGMTADAVEQAKRRVLRRIRAEVGDLEDFGQPR
jgi:RNA polymerase sigma-70 factor (ECF subfamily)